MEATDSISAPVTTLQQGCYNGDSEAGPEEFIYSERDFLLDGVGWHLRTELEIEPKPTREHRYLSAFDLSLRSGWEQKMKMGLFCYSLEDLQTRILPGPYRYVAQLNIKRGTERRKPQDIRSVSQNYDPTRFNFSQIKPGEVIFHMRKCGLERTGSVPGDKPRVNAPHCGLNPDQDGSDSQLDSVKTLVVINVSPLEFGHVLFVPDPAMCLPQILTRGLIQTGIESVLLSAHPGFRVGFNSLCAFASVNHLHLHGYYLDQELLIETAQTHLLCPGLRLHTLSNHPARGLLFYTRGHGAELGELVEQICKVTDFLVTKNIAHNLFVTRGSPPGEDGCQSRSRTGIRIILWARKSSFGVKEESAFNVALCELAGHLPIKNSEDFHSMTEAKVTELIQRYMVPEEEFLQLLSELVEVLKDS